MIHHPEPGDVAVGPVRPLRPLDKWEVRKNPLTGIWYAQPIATGLWATPLGRQKFFATWRTAFDYAFTRTAR